MADGQEQSHPPVVVDQQETPLEKHETEPLKGKMSIAPSVVSNKPGAKTHHVSVHQSEHRSEAIELTTLQIEKKRGVIIPSSHPIPADVKSVHSSDSELDQDKKPPKGDGKEIDEKGNKEKHSKIEEKESEWSDEEACGLGRCESRASRVSRAVHKMFCCGVTYEAPSDEDVSSPRPTHIYGSCLRVNCIPTASKLHHSTHAHGISSKNKDATLQVVEQREVSWHKRGVQEHENFQEIDLPSTSASLTLVRKASVGPCRTFASVGGPSGISINIPRALKIGQTLHSIPTEKQDTRCLAEIQHFASLMNFQGSEITLYGYFPVDATLMFNMLASAMMYMIILVQFDKSD